jgi:predicted secreted Zn-dependent protease
MKRLKRTTVRLHLVGILPEWEHADMTTVEIAERVYDMMITDLGEEYRPEGTQNT